MREVENNIRGENKKCIRVLLRNSNSKKVVEARAYQSGTDLGSMPKEIE